MAAVRRWHEEEERKERAARTLPLPTPTRDEPRLRIDFDRLKNGDAERILAHVMGHQPKNVVELRRLFKPYWKAGKRELIDRIKSNLRWKVAGIGVTYKGELRYGCKLVDGRLYAPGVAPPSRPTPPPRPAIPEPEQLAGADGLDAPEGTSDRSPPLIAPPARLPLDSKRAEFYAIDLKAQNKQLRWFRSYAELAALRIDKSVLHEPGDLGGRIGLTTDQYGAYKRANGRFPHRVWPASLSDPKVRKNWQKKFGKDETMMQLEQHPQAPPARPPATKIEALIRVVTMRMKLTDAVDRVRKTDAWRYPDGKMLAVRTVRNKVRDMVAGCPEIIGYEVAVEDGKAIAFLWPRKHARA
jgi:hypothetical protein